jgi:hypothetical protein
VRSYPIAADLTNHPNVVVLRTFSKAYGLAGLAGRLRHRAPGGGYLDPQGDATPSR